MLGDIEIAQNMQKDKVQPAIGEVPHPLDANYDSLKAKLEHVQKTDPEYKVIDTYLKSTEPAYRKLEIIDVWRVDRTEEVRETTCFDNILHYYRVIDLLNMAPLKTDVCFGMVLMLQL